ncbi:HIRAN domain-containing protein [Microbacterium kyungheense]|uniref:HIRAN domain-containing protein n=1 Tax=Microbacterium kyungheense TaxID=1263636 RepID=A0A543EAQ4_9MICO|nr:HIRAN domain-containing protein [Microbacterium kyungheense]TQM18673.1 HIRAN domain-containing protein [Microbacterium kyungheense]
MAGGFLSKLFGGDKTKMEPTPAPRAQPSSPASAPGREVPIGFGEDLEVSGEAYYRDGIGKIFRSLGRPEGGVTMQTAWLIPEPDNKYDPNAVRVVVMGEQVGHVPQEVSASVMRACRGVGRGNVATVPARVWARNDDGTWRGRVTLAFSGETESEKDYAAERQEADAYYAEREAEQARKAAEREAREAHKEARRTAGEVEGQYWPLLKPSISELKRQKRFEEARDLLEQCIYAAERESVVTGEVPDPWPSEQISVVLRRLRDYPHELAFLERYVAACGDREIPESVTMRLSRSRLAVQNGGTPEE